MAGLAMTVSAAYFVLGAIPAVGEAESEDREQDGFVLEEVIVTADRKEQSLLDIPVSVTAFDSGMIEDYQITNNKDLEVRVPGLQFGLDSPATIRGMGSLYRGLAGDVAVAQYSNDLYFDEPYGVISSLYDIDRVEVLRGPQGTLYGRNSIGGAINYINKRPEWEFGAGTTAELSSYNGRRLNGFVTGPINDSVAYRLTVEWQETDGNQENISGGDLGAKGDYNLSPQLAFQHGPVTLNLRYSSFEQDAKSEVRVPVRYPSTQVEFHPNPIDGQPSGERNNYYMYPRSTPPATAGRDLANKVDMNRQGSTDVSRDAITLHATYELTENLSIKYILGDSDLTLGLLGQDFDGTSLVGSAADPFLSSNAMRPFPDIAIDFVYDVLLTTHELQVAFDTERLSAIAGAYYLDQEYESTINIFDYANRAVHTNTDDLWRSVLGFGFTDVFGERLQLSDDRWITPHVPDGSSHWYFAPTVRTVESWAVFSQATYEINSAWRVTAGLRYTEDEKRIVQDEDHVVIGEFDPLGVLLGDGTDFTRTAPAVFNRITPLLVQNFDKITGNVSIEHTTARGELIYGRISTGYRSGGPVIDRPPPFDRYDDENLISYEAGYKGDLFEDRVRLLVSGFLYDFGNYQQIIRLRELEPVPRNFTVIDNLPDTTMQGVEIEATFNISENARLSGFYAYQTSSLGPVMIPDRLDPDQEFDRVEYVSPNTGQPAVAYLERPVDLEGNELPNMPNHKWSVTADYAHPLGNGGQLLFSTSYSFTGERFNRIHNIPYDVLDSYTRWDGSVTWIPGAGNRSLTFFVENINDRIGIMELESNGWSDGYYQDATLTDPQFMGLVFRWESSGMGSDPILIGNRRGRACPVPLRRQPQGVGAGDPILRVAGNRI